MAKLYIEIFGVLGYNITYIKKMKIYFQFSNMTKVLFKVFLYTKGVYFYGTLQSTFKGQ